MSIPSCHFGKRTALEKEVGSMSIDESVMVAKLACLVDLARVDGLRVMV